MTLTINRSFFFLTPVHIDPPPPTPLVKVKSFWIVILISSIPFFVFVFHLHSQFVCWLIFLRNIDVRINNLTIKKRVNRQPFILCWRISLYLQWISDWRLSLILSRHVNFHETVNLTYIKASLWSKNTTNNLMTLKNHHKL